MKLNRRKLLQVLAATGIGTATLHRAVVALAQQDEDKFKITKDLLKQAEWISGNSLDEKERDGLLSSLQQNHRAMENLRKMEITADDAPAISFGTLESQTDKGIHLQRAVRLNNSAGLVRPDSDEKLAFMSVVELSKLIKTRQVSSVELTKLYLKRLRKYDPMLKFVVNYTEELAMEAAERADKEISLGRYRGPLHGIPWGAKDLISVPGYPTTWGIPQLQTQVLQDRATVFQRLEQAGAVLIAKLSLGALAMGDQWFGGKTRSPWNPKLGSSGSSAGSASATVAGCVGFSLGSETLGSILSPARRCGANGLRPTFGRVSRYGCMPLSWTMDKIGPITRNVEDTALVLAAIHGADAMDATAIDKPFDWPPKVNLRELSVGYTNLQGRKVEDRDDLRILKDLGVNLVEVELPKSIPLRTLTNVIGVEGAAVFEKMLNKSDVEGWNAWPRIFRAAQYMTAVDYLRIMRFRRKLQLEFETVMKNVDVLVNANDLVHTNLTGHPSVVFPVSYRERNGRKSPRSIVFTGQLYGETQLLAVALAYQNNVTAHLEHPPLDDLLAAYLKEESERAAAADADSADEKKKDNSTTEKKKKDKRQ